MCSIYVFFICILDMYSRYVFFILILYTTLSLKLKLSNESCK